MSLLENMAVHVISEGNCEPEAPRLVLHVFPRSERESIRDSFPPSVVVKNDKGGLSTVPLYHCRPCTFAHGAERCAGCDGCTGAEGAWG